MQLVKRSVSCQLEFSRTMLCLFNMLRLLSICFIYTAPQASNFEHKPCINKVTLPFYLYDKKHIKQSKSRKTKSIDFIYKIASASSLASFYKHNIFGVQVQTITKIALATVAPFCETLFLVI